METQNQTVSGLISSCEKQTTFWPVDGPGVVYLRVYTQADPRHVDVGNEAGVYTGWTAHAPMRNERHTRQISKPPRVTDRPSHYNIARMVRHCQVLIVLHQDGGETLGTAGTREAARMAEQTAMLMVKSYASWTNSDKMDLHIQRARLLQAVEKQVRSATGFQPTWRLRHGTNVSSPMFEVTRFWALGLKRPAPIQTISVLPLHPKLPGRTIVRATVTFHHYCDTPGLETVFSGHRSGDPKPASRVLVRIPSEIATQIRQSVEPQPSRDPILATLAFELMDGGHDHERPYYGLPAVGPYRNFGAANALGIRVEWKHHTQDRWFSAPIQIHFLRHNRIGNALTRGDVTKLERLYQEATALVQMIRGEECPQAPQGFWRSLGFRGTRPVIQKLEVSHLQQTIRWVAHLHTQVAPPTRSTAEENRRLLYDNKAPIMTVGARLPTTDPFWHPDDSSSLSVSAGKPRCDTCTIFARRGTSRRSVQDPCDYDPATQTCAACKAMNRICTFTPMAKLLAGWVGRDVDVKDYRDSTVAFVLFPRYGGGPLRKLVSHLGMAEDEIRVTEIKEPQGWESLYPLLESGEEDDGTEDVDMEDASADEDQEDED